MQQELGACRVLRRRRPRRFAVAGDWKVDPLACFCAFLAPGAVARAELSMGKDFRTLDAAAPHPVDSRRAARRAQVACIHGSFRRVSDELNAAPTARWHRAPHEEPFATLHTLQPSISERKTHR